MVPGGPDGEDGRQALERLRLTISATAAASAIAPPARSGFGTWLEPDLRRRESLSTDPTTRPTSEESIGRNLPAGLLAHPPGHPRLQRPDLDEARRGRLGEQAAGLGERGELRVVDGVRRLARDH